MAEYIEGPTKYFALKGLMPMLLLGLKVLWLCYFSHLWVGASLEAIDVAVDEGGADLELLSFLPHGSWMVISLL